MTLFGISWGENVPGSEFCREFIQGMADRMQTSWFKYGNVRDAYPQRVDAVGSLKKRLERYERDGNTEWLMDVGNFAMIEFMAPKHPNAHYRPTDSGESPGRKWVGEVDPSHRGNRPETWVK